MMHLITILLALIVYASAKPLEEDTKTLFSINIPYTEGLIPAQGEGFYTPDTDGNIHIKGLKPIKKANSLTTLQIHNLISKQLPKNIAENITVNKINYSTKNLKLKNQILILGLIKNKGNTQINELNSIEAMITAAKPSPFAALNRIKLIRLEKTFTYDLRKPEHASLKVQAGDIILIPQKHYIGR